MRVSDIIIVVMEASTAQVSDARNQLASTLKNSLPLDF